MSIQAEPAHNVRKGDWIRYQIKSNRIVLEGFVQEVSSDGSRVRIGRAPAPLENNWYSLTEISILHQQRR